MQLMASTNRVKEITLYQKTPTKLFILLESVITYYILCAQKLLYLITIITHFPTSITYLHISFVPTNCITTSC